MAKRGQGEGTISKRPDGTWWARITIGKTPDGKQKRKAFYGKTRREVQEKLTAAINEVNIGIYIEPSKMTVAQWMEVWLKDYKKISVKIKTFSNYESVIDNHIKPYLGQYKLKDLKNNHVQGWVNELSDKGLSPDYVDSIFTALKAALEQAIDNEMIAKNPSNKITLPKKEQKEARFLTKEEQSVFVEACKEFHNGEFYIFILSTGLRLGEAAGLTWADIDFQNKMITINKTLVNPWDCKQKGGGVIYSTPKTKSSNRNVPLMPAAIKILEELKSRQILEKKKFGEKYCDNNLIFCTAHGTPISRFGWNSKIKNICRKINLEGVHTHTLRHTFATRGMENGIPLKAMQELLGHAKMQITSDVYTHVSSEQKKEAILRLEETIKL